jgi:hypothetical protein
MSLFVLTSLLLASSPATPGWAFATPSLVKVRPAEIVEHQQGVMLVLGRNECQGAQVVAQDARPIFELRVAAAPLKGPQGQALEVTLAREQNLTIQHASNGEGRTGPWPDILIPAVDPIAHEARRAYPVDVAGGAPLVSYLEVCAGAATLPGLYRGEVVLTARGRTPAKLPIEVRVLHYTLPATSTLPTAFGFSGLSAAHAHGLDARDPEVVLGITERYATLALAHRISLFGMTMAAPPFKASADGHVEVDFRDYDRELAPLMDGTALPSGATFTSLELRGPAGKVPDAVRVAYYRATVAHLQARGWLDRLFLYAPDEPTPEKFPLVQHVAALAHQADPRIRVLVTSSRQEALVESADLWVPNIVCSFPRQGRASCPREAPLAAYAPDRQKGKKLWWYQSCMSHGCGPESGADTAAQAGWPSYMVDHPGVLNRAMGVAAFRNGVEGELYYSTTEAYDKDPWQEIWRFDGNGDGTLFYPGSPAKIGGKTDVPLASLRLKLIRDGLQDYELFRLADANGLHDLAVRTAAALVPEPFHIERDPNAWISARRKLALALDQKLAPPTQAEARSAAGE